MIGGAGEVSSVPDADVARFFGALEILTIMSMHRFGDWPMIMPRKLGRQEPIKKSAALLVELNGVTGDSAVDSEMMERLWPAEFADGMGRIC